MSTPTERELDYRLAVNMLPNEHDRVGFLVNRMSADLRTLDDLLSSILDHVETIRRYHEAQSHG